MNTATSLVGAATLAAFLVLAPVSAVDAQGPRGHQGGRHQGNIANNGHPASANQPRTAARQHPAARANAVANKTPSKAPVVAGLHSAATNLNQAEQDYNGHRARALLEVNAALRYMNAQNGQTSQGTTGLSGASTSTGQRSTLANGAGTGTGNAIGTGLGSSQVASDAQLRQALQSLLAIESQMGNGGTAQGNSAQAMASVQQAITELSAALSGTG